MPKKKSSPTKPPAEDPARFEHALEELESIVAEMGGDRVPLDELLKKYERGTNLLRLCQGRINEARARIEKIAGTTKNGAAGLEPFDPESGGSNETAGSVSSKEPEKSTRDDEIQLL